MRMEEADIAPYGALCHEVWYALNGIMQGRRAEKACIEMMSWCSGDTNAANISSTSIMSGRA